MSIRRYLGFMWTPRFHFSGYLGPVTSERPSRVPEFGRPDAHEFSIGKKTHKVADIAPLDVTGVRTMLVGTALWGVAAVVMLPFWTTLRDSGRTWWMWTALAGFGLGLLGLEYCRSRASALKNAGAEVVPGGGRPRRLARRGKKAVNERLLAAAPEETPAANGDDFTRDSLARKHSLSVQVPTLADENSNEPIAEESSAIPPVESLPARPVGRRRKPEPEET